MSLQTKTAKPVSFGRHRRNCTVCAHERCGEIETDFVGWKSPTLIAQEYSLADRTSVYRHAHAYGLFEKRKRNVRAALERIIEKAGEWKLHPQQSWPLSKPTLRSTHKDNGLTAASILTSTHCSSA